MDLDGTGAWKYYRGINQAAFLDCMLSNKLHSYAFFILIWIMNELVLALKDTGYSSMGCDIHLLRFDWIVKSGFCMTG